MRKHAELTLDWGCTSKVAAATKERVNVSLMVSQELNRLKA